MVGMSTAKKTRRARRKGRSRGAVLLTFSVESNITLKFYCLVDAMGGGVEDVKAFPQYFSFNLEKRIVSCHQAAAEAGVALPFLDMLKATDDEFTKMLEEKKLLLQQTATTDSLDFQ
jgi:mTERF domain-containing protein, mitochondrial